MEILLLISVYALSCNFFLFGLLWKSWYFQFKNSVGKSEKCHLFFFFFSVKTAVSDEQVFSTRWERLGGSVCPWKSPEVSVPQIAPIWDPAQVLQLALKLQRHWDGFGGKTITSPQPGTNPALGKSCSGSEQGVCIPNVASGCQGAPVWALVPQPGACRGTEVLLL